MIIASGGLYSCVTPLWLASNQYNMTKLMVCTWLFVHDYMMMLHKTVAPVLLECPSSCWLWGGKSHAGKPPRDKELCLWTSENPDALSATAARQWVQPTIYASETGSIPSGNFKCDPSPGFISDCETLSRGPDWDVSELLTHINWDIIHVHCVTLLNRW